MLLDVAVALNDEGHDVEVLTSSAAYTGNDESKVQKSVGNVRTVWTPANGRLLSWVVFLIQAAVRLPFMKWDRCILLTDPPMLLAALLCLRKRERRVFWWTMDLYPEALAAHGMLEEGGLAYRTLARLNTAALRKVDGVITLGACQTRRLKSYTTWPDRGTGAVTEIPPWDYRPLPRVERSSNQVLADHGWEDYRVALYAGNMGEAHSFEELLAAARLLAADPASRWMFAFVVRGAGREALEDASRDLPNVAVLDYLPPDQTADLLWSADLHLITMRPGWEGIVVPSKLYGVLTTDAPVLFIGPVEADTALEIKRYNRGEVLPPGSDASVVRTTMDDLVSHAKTSFERPERDAPQTIVDFVMA